MSAPTATYGVIDEQAYVRNAAAELRDIEREMRQQGYEQAGRQMLGYEFIRTETARGWARRRTEQLPAGLPIAVVEAARSAAAAEDAAYQAAEHRTAAALRYINEHGLSDQAARTYAELHTAEAMTALRKASAIAGRSCAQLGQVAEQVAAARQTLADAPNRKATIEREAAAALRQVEHDEEQARQQLSRLGVV